MADAPAAASASLAASALPEMEEAHWEPIGWDTAQEPPANAPSGPAQAAPMPQTAPPAEMEPVSEAEPMPGAEQDIWTPGPDNMQTYDTSESRRTLGDALSEMMPHDIRRQWEEEGFSLPDNGTDPSDALTRSGAPEPDEKDDWRPS